MTRREFFAISDRMKLKAAEQLEARPVNSKCKVLVQTKDNELFLFATLSKGENETTERQNVCAMNVEVMFFKAGNSALVCVPYSSVTAVTTQIIEPEQGKAEQNQ